MSREPSDYAKIAVGVFTTLVAATVMGLVVTVINLKSDAAVRDLEISHLKKQMPEVAQALKDHTKAINELRIVIEGMKK
jgi:hypothetical protein